jgi:Flp pilus assembly protein TadD
VLTYRDARQHARAIVKATASGFMPPWLPLAGYGEFTGQRRLTDREIDSIRRWEAAGAIEGEPGALPSEPATSDGWRLGEPDLVLRLPKPFTLPAGGTDVWRNFVIPVPITAARFVKTVELRPGNLRVVHHALVATDETRSSTRRDSRDAEMGFEGMDMGDARAPDGHLLGWSPGMTPFPGIDGEAWQLVPGTDIVLQLHLMPSGKEERIDPLVGLFFSDRAAPGSTLHLMRLDADQALDIPPEAKHFAVSDSFQLPVDLEVLAVYPHAHFLATTVEAFASTPGGSDVWLIKIDKWDFKWQDIYRYAKTMALPRGTTITLKFTYDNSAGNPRNPNRPPRRVIAGMRSSDEMAHVQLQVRARDASDLMVLREALYQHALRKNPDDAWADYELGNLRRDLGDRAQAVRHYRNAIARRPEHAAARNNLGVVLTELDEGDEAISQYRQALALEPDFADAHYNLANALRARSRFDDALGHYQRALRLEPRLADAHNNLGELLASQHRLREAQEHFEQAIRLRSDSAQAHNNLGASLGLQGNLVRAIAEFREALRIDPAHAGARENLKLALERNAR